MNVENNVSKNTTFYTFVTIQTATFNTNYKKIHLIVHKTNEVGKYTFNRNNLIAKKWYLPDNLQVEDC